MHRVAPYVEGVEAILLAADRFHELGCGDCEESMLLHHVERAARTARLHRLLPLVPDPLGADLPVRAERGLGRPPGGGGGLPLESGHEPSRSKYSEAVLGEPFRWIPDGLEDACF